MAEIAALFVVGIALAIPLWMIVWVVFFAEPPK